MKKEFIGGMQFSVGHECLHIVIVYIWLSVSNSVIGKVVRGVAFLLLEIWLVPDLPGGLTHDSLGPMLFPCVSPVFDEEGVHLRHHAKEIGDRLAIRVFREIDDHFVVGRVEEWSGIVE